MKGDEQEMKKRRILRKRAKGSVLLMVVTIMSLAALLGTAALALSDSVYNQTHLDYRQQQAYYNAESSLNGIISHICNKPGSELDSLLSSLTVGVPAGPYEVKGLNGDSTYIVFEKQTNEQIKVTATSTYAGATRVVSAYINRKPTHYFNSVFTSLGNSITINQVNRLDGELYLVNENEWKLPEGMTFDGTIKNTGPIQIQGNNYNSTSTSRVISSTQIRLTNNPVLPADLYAPVIKLENVSNVYGDLYVLNRLELNIQCVFHGNIYLAPSATISDISKIQFADPSLRIMTWNKAEMELENEFYYVETYEEEKYPLVTQPPSDDIYYTELHSVSQNLTLISNSRFTADQNIKYNLHIVTTNGEDRYIHVRGNRFNVDNLSIEGNGNVYIYVQGEYYGGGKQGYNIDGRIYDDDQKPQLYIISLTHSEINLRDPKCTEFSGYIYSPKSKVLLPTNNESPAQITGSVIAYEFHDITNMKLKYISPPANPGVSMGIPGPIPENKTFEVLGFANS